MKYRVAVDVAPNTIEGTSGCHKYVFGEYETKGEAVRISEMINRTKGAGRANIEKIK